MTNIYAIIPTFNRKQHLLHCLDRLLSQSYAIRKIIIVDNASSDGTGEILSSKGYLDNPAICYLRLEENTGGAGGYFAGINHALNQDFDWLWLMDDDAIADISALEYLVKHAVEKNDIYCSTALAEDNNEGLLCWPAMDQEGNIIEYSADMETVNNVGSLPFLGFFIHRKLIEKIGLPEKDYFILGDDMEYAVRAVDYGARLWLVRDSIIRHPLPVRHIFSFLGRKFYNLVLPPWKKYYDVRNRVLIARKYYGIRLWTRTIPGQIIRMGDSFLHEPDRLKMLWAYLRGILDGFLGRRGKRVIPG